MLTVIQIVLFLLNVLGWLVIAAAILSLLFSAISWVVQLIVQSVIIKGSLELTRGRPLDGSSATSGINWGQVIIASLICVVMAVIFDLLLVLLQALITPWRSEGAVKEHRKGRFFEMFRRTAS